MILSGKEIIKERAAGRILIDPFRPENVGPNSVDLTLGPIIKTYVRRSPCKVIDPRELQETVEHYIGPSGFVIEPGCVYLGCTVEKAGSDYYLPEIDGRSSWGRLGVSVHLTAGRGETGWTGKHWTLEITAVYPTLVRVGDRFCQIYFQVVQGEISLYRGRYSGDSEAPEEARLHLGQMPSIVTAGVGPGHPLMACSWCNRVFEEGDERIATCTQTVHVTLCRECYRKAGNSVR